tara:strand:- start:981 stop:1736 length:756 start_codon:yes stop_codon:yes gene_type:complete
MPLDEDIPQHLIDLYHHELYFLLREIIQKYNQITEAIDEYVKSDKFDSKSSTQLLVDYDIHYDIMAMVTCASNVKKLVKPRIDDKALKNVSKKMRRLRTYRAMLYERIFRSMEIVEMYSSEARNSIEHYDEYLDRTILELSKHCDSDVAITMNVQLCTATLADPPNYPLKTYVISTRTFYNLGKTVCLENLKAEAQSMLDLLDGLIDPFVRPKDFKPGGMIWKRGKPDTKRWPKFLNPFLDPRRFIPDDYN